MRLSRETLKAIDRHDEKIDAYAREKYGISGAALLAKLVSGESGDRMDSVSTAGARGKTQFIESTRNAVVRQTGGKVDPWRNTDDAIEGAVLHLLGKLGNAKGLEGYNPGMASYPQYILDQKVGDVRGQIRGLGGDPGGKGGGSSPSPTDPGLTLAPGKVTVGPERDTRQAVMGLLNGGGALQFARDIRAAEDAAAGQQQTIALPGGTSAPVVTAADHAASTVSKKGRSRPSGDLNAMRQKIEAIYDKHGVTVTARQEPGHQVGGDHDPGVLGATAIDGGAGEAEREAAFREIAKLLGVPNAKYKGPDINVTIKGIRYQIISRDHGTGPHLHSGLRKVNR